MLFAVPYAQAQQAPDYGFDWVTVGAPGNSAFPGHQSTGAFAGRGSVGYEYRLSRTEVTVPQYLEFVRAYAPFSGFGPGDPYLTGSCIYWAGGDSFTILPGYEHAPTNMSIRMAARFCNWLENGKVNEAWAFESGVYDATTFYETMNPNGTRVFHDDYTRAPNAQFWMPSVDEWLKGVYFDPNRFGPTQEGWWLYPDSSNDPLIIGPPDQGGETSATGDGYWDISAGSYPHVQSPWGLLDVSGGVAEYTDDRRGFGSSIFDSDVLVEPFDQAGQQRRSNLAGDSVNVLGLRLAAAVPAPSCLPAFVVFSFVVNRRRRDINATVSISSRHRVVVRGRVVGNDRTS